MTFFSQADMYKFVQWNIRPQILNTSPLLFYYFKAVSYPLLLLLSRTPLYLQKLKKKKKTIYTLKWRMGCQVWSTFCYLILRYALVHINTEYIDILVKEQKWGREWVGEETSQVLLPESLSKKTLTTKYTSNSVF